MLDPGLGTRALIQCRRLAWAADADFELTALSDPVRRLFALARMHAVFGTV